MRGIFPTLLAFVFGLFVLIMAWVLLNRGAKTRRALISDTEVDNTATEIIEQHGEAAGDEIAGRIAKCLANGDFEGEAVWQRVAKAVERLQSD